MDLNEWVKETVDTMTFHFEHDEPGMAFRVWLISMRELRIMAMEEKIARKRQALRKDINAFNLMCQMKSYLRDL